MFKRILLVIVSIVILAVSFKIMHTSITEALEINKAEGKCIAKLIAQEVERRDIVTHNGTCSIK